MPHASTMYFVQVLNINLCLRQCPLNAGMKNQNLSKYICLKKIVSVFRGNKNKNK